MKIIDNENVVGIDCDDTLVMWDAPTVPGPGKIAVEFAGDTVYLTPHNYHIQLVKKYQERGYYLIFWSANGAQHFSKVLTALGLDYLADGKNGHVQTKLCKHMDDSTNAEGILGPRVYCNDLTKQPLIFMPAGIDIINL